MAYTHLADAQLVYISGMDPVVDPTSVPGQLLGSGNGAIEGPHLKGEMRWSFFEEGCAWDPGVLGVESLTTEAPDRSVCRTYPRGVIETDDGALIQFEAQGFALRRVDDPLWNVGSTVRFVTNNDGYKWATEGLAVYEGVFDERTGTATWSFHAPDHMLLAAIS